MDFSTAIKFMAKVTVLVIRICELVCVCVCASMVASRFAELPCLDSLSTSVEITLFEYENEKNYGDHASFSFILDKTLKKYTTL